MPLAHFSVQYHRRAIVPRAIFVVWRPTFREKLVDQSRSTNVSGSLLFIGFWSKDVTRSVYNEKHYSGNPGRPPVVRVRESERANARSRPGGRKRREIWAWYTCDTHRVQEICEKVIAGVFGPQLYSEQFQFSPPAWSDLAAADTFINVCVY